MFPTSHTQGDSNSQQVVSGNCFQLLRISIELQGVAILWQEIQTFETFKNTVNGQKFTIKNLFIGYLSKKIKHIKSFHEKCITWAMKNA